MSIVDSSMLCPRTSSDFIMKSAIDVSINDQKASELAASLLSGSMDCDMATSSANQERWDSHPLNIKAKDGPDAALSWIFLVDTLNFSFWSSDQKNKYSVSLDGTPYTGYWSLCSAVNRAIREGIPITSASFYSKITQEQLAHIFRPDDGCSQQMPMLEERVRVLQETGAILVEKYSGSFARCIELANGSASSLLQLIVSSFPSYRDEAVYAGEKVAFYKRAQIVIADVWACFGGKSIGAFHDIDKITMFADYRIPQALAYFGVLEYSEKLMDLLKGDHEFSHGDQEECELRAASIVAIDRLCAEVQRQAASASKEVHVNAIVLDHFLWDYRRQFDTKTSGVLFHKIRCIFY